MNRNPSGLRAELERRLAALSPAKRALAVDGLPLAADAAGPVVKPRPPGARVPLSFAQELLWLLERAAPGYAYNVPRLARLRGSLDLPALQRALDAVVARHEILRTTFELREGEPQQIVRAAAAVPIARIELTALPEEGREPEAVSVVQRLLRRPFDLERDLQLRVTLVELASDDRVLLLESHHVASDAWSRNILLRELTTLYDAFRNGRALELPPLPVQYGDFAIWQRETLQGARLEELMRYWRERLAGAPPAVELPTDRPYSPVPNFDGAARSSVSPPALLEELRTFGRAHNATLFMVLLAAFAVLLSRYGGQDDVLIGSPIAGRSNDEIEGLVGYFSNTLVLRASLAGDPSFVELLARVRETCLGAYEHQDVPFEKLVLDLAPLAVRGRSPLVQAMFTLQDAELATLRLAGTTVVPFGSERGATKFDLSLFAQERPEGLRTELHYRTQLFDAATIDGMLGAFATLLAGLVANPARPVSEPTLLSSTERERFVDRRNATASPYPRDATIHELVENQAARTPEAVAVEGATLSGDVERLTYRELDARSTALAAHLRSLGVGPEVPVGIYAERSLELVVALLGVLKAGGYYVPLDPQYPAERIAFMLGDAAVPVLLTQARLRASLPVPADSAGPVVRCLDTEWDAISAPADALPPRASAAAGNLAYVMYTSGSTGRPKGVMVTHRAVVNYLTWMQRTYRPQPGEGVFSRAPISFDISVWEMFLPLLCGARLVLAPTGPHLDPLDVLQAWQRHDVRIAQLVPSQLEMILEAAGAAGAPLFGRLRRLFLGGERLPSELLDRLQAACPGLPVTNFYGPTEATIFATHWDVAARTRTPGETVSLGEPIANVSIFVVDRHGEPVAAGIPGELWIGGEGLARGYLRRPELTAERFVPSSLAGGTPLYRTGDAARYRSDGTLEYLGRLDTQIKLRGFRVELGEIEAALAAQPEVAAAAVLVRGEGDSAQLVAYCIYSSPGPAPAPATAKALRLRLTTVLPDFMVPSVLTWVEAWPLNANGKLDRAALARIDGGSGAAPAEPAAFVAPVTPTEQRLARIWAEVLRRDAVGATEHFFDLGGHSLLAMRIISRIFEECSVRVPLGTIFERATVAELAAWLDEESARPPAAVEPALVRVPRAAYRPKLTAGISERSP